MNKKFDENEAKFIAKLILNRLEIPQKNRNTTIKMQKPAINILRHIENMEKKWVFRVSEKKVSFGRKTPTEFIRLWSVPPMTARVLGYLVLYTGSRNILEIGTSAGYSTIHLANAARYIKGHVYTIESFDKKIELAKNNFNKADLGTIISVLEGDALSIARELEYGKIDFVFLDADKKKYGKYFDLLMPLIRNGGIIVADNINDYGHLMEDYLQKVSGSHFPESRCDRRVKSTYIAQLDNGIMITKKIGD